MLDKFFMTKTERAFENRKKRTQEWLKQINESTAPITLSKVDSAAVDETIDVVHPELDKELVISQPQLNVSTNNPIGTKGVITREEKSGLSVIETNTVKFPQGRERVSSPEHNVHCTITDIPGVGRIVQLLQPAKSDQHPVGDFIASSVGSYNVEGDNGKRTIITGVINDGLSNRPVKKEEFLLNENLFPAAETPFDSKGELIQVLAQPAKIASSATKIAAESAFEVGLKNSTVRALKESRASKHEGISTSQSLSITIDDRDPDNMYLEAVALGQGKNIASTGITIIDIATGTIASKIPWNFEGYNKKTDPNTENPYYLWGRDIEPSICVSRIVTSTGKRIIKPEAMFNAEVEDTYYTEIGDDYPANYIPYLVTHPNDFYTRVPKSSIIIQTSDGVVDLEPLKDFIGHYYNMDAKSTVALLSHKDFFHACFGDHYDDRSVWMFIPEINSTRESINAETNIAENLTKGLLDEIGQLSQIIKAKQLLIEQKRNEINLFTNSAGDQISRLAKDGVTKEDLVFIQQSSSEALSMLQSEEQLDISEKLLSEYILLISESEGRRRFQNSILLDVVSELQNKNTNLPTEEILHVISAIKSASRGQKHKKGITLPKSEVVEEVFRVMAKHNFIHVKKGFEIEMSEWIKKPDSAFGPKMKAAFKETPTTSINALEKIIRAKIPVKQTDDYKDLQEYRQLLRKALRDLR